MQKKRLVYLSAFLSPYRSGAEAMVEEVAQRLSDEYDITIVTGRYSRSLPTKDTLGGKVSVIRVGLGLSIDKWLFPFLAPLELGALKPDIIHAVLETFAGLTLFFCRCNAKKILTLQTTNRSFLKGQIIRYPDTVTAISTALVKIAASYGRKDVVLIPNGIDLKAIEEACQFHAKVPGRILFVGRLEAMKGVDTLLRAVSDKRLATRNWMLRIVGSGSEEASLKALAQKLGIADRIIFTGRLTGRAVFDEYAQAEIFCGLSRSEALGNVFLEAQAAGCAVIASNIGGIPDIVKNNQTGILISPDDITMATLVIQKLLNDAGLRERLQHAGTEHAMKYDWTTISKKYQEIYRE